jgi:hypothetical protein
MDEANFQSDQDIADAYGLPYIFDNSEYVMEDNEVSFNRVVQMHKATSLWIEKHRRIPSSSPKAEKEERKIAIWLRVVLFYKDVILDPHDVNREERESNENTHILCQKVIRTGRLPQGDEEYEQS